MFFVSSQPFLVNLWLSAEGMSIFCNHDMVWHEDLGLSQDLDYSFAAHFNEEEIENLVNKLLTFVTDGTASEALLLFPPDECHPVFLLTPHPLKELIPAGFTAIEQVWRFDYSHTSDDYLYGYSLGTLSELTFSGILESLQDPNLAQQQPLRVLSDYTDFSYPTYSTQSVKNLYDSLLSLQIWQ